MKQTAVDWLIGQLYAPCRGIPSHIIEQAKEMEKEQMIDWYATGQADTVNMYEQHLNKTFNTNEK
jgi:hypothetical protein